LSELSKLSLEILREKIREAEVNFGNAEKFSPDDEDVYRLISWLDDAYHAEQQILAQQEFERFFGEKIPVEKEGYERFHIGREVWKTGPVAVARDEFGRFVKWVKQG
jgi:hypothetical protein